MRGGECGSSRWSWSKHEIQFLSSHSPHWQVGKAELKLRGLPRGGIEVRKR
jgi:hypothetical protein